MRKLLVTVSVVLTLAVPALAVSDHVVAAHRDAGKFVALTFDDGPHPHYTEEILAILAENHAHATFFVIGENAERHPELIKAEFDAGHEIGNHTYSHPMMNKLAVTDAVEEIRKTQTAVEHITGCAPRVFRSPGGYYSDELVEAVEAIGCKPVLWSWRQDTKDWQSPPVDKVVHTVLDNLQDGDIILFHDFIGKNSPTPAALRIILPALAERGYRFVTVSELMQMKRTSGDEAVPAAE